MRSGGARRGRPPLSAEPYREEDRGYETPCWVWQRAMSWNGYGKLWDGGHRRLGEAHRLYYERLRGPIADGLDIDHLCRVRACVNPDHMEPVTRAVNLRRGAAGRLSVADAESIRASTETNAALARHYGVDPSTISRTRYKRRRR